VLDIDIYASGLAASMGLGVGGWLVSLRRKGVGVADILWPISFMLMTIVYVLSIPITGQRPYVVFFLLGVWGARLASFLLRRSLEQTEDRRYQALRRQVGPGFAHRSLYLVFGLQAILAWMMSLSLYMAIAGTTPLGALDYAAALLWLVGFFFEVIGDEQLYNFRENPQNRNRVLDQGLWRLSRHPNYFGELCIWWAFWLFAVAAGGWWTLPAPLLATYLLVALAGIPLAERGIEERRPGYGDYARRTSALIPWPPRRG
jgi:steroid 5-alpha reductase family enzyme